jgi:dipeptide/tripeptide permease
VLNSSTKHERVLVETRYLIILVTIVHCAGTELAERVGSLGLQRNLVVFFTSKMNISNVNAANMVSNFTGAVYLTPFIGGFVADASLGRFWVIVSFGIVQVVVSEHSWKLFP